MKKTLILIAAIIGVFVLFINMSGDKFRQRVEQEKKKMLSAAKLADWGRNSKASIAQLPKPVRKYLEFALGDDLRRIQSVSMKQSGMFRAAARDNWVKVTADQLVTPGTTSFVWHARLEPLPYLWTESRDILFDGQARMEHRLYSAFTLQFEAGKEADFSALVQFLSETPWFPTALFPNEHLKWSVIDDRNARAVLSAGGYQVSAVFTFGDRGEIVRITTNDRYKTTKGMPEKALWTAHYRTYDEHSGITIPMEIEAEWYSKEKKYSYMKLKIDAVDFERM